MLHKPANYVLYKERNFSLRVIMTHILRVTRASRCCVHSVLRHFRCPASAAPVCKRYVGSQNAVTGLQCLADDRLLLQYGPRLNVRSTPKYGTDVLVRPTAEVAHVSNLLLGEQCDNRMFVLWQHHLCQHSALTYFIQGIQIYIIPVMIVWAALNFSLQQILSTIDDNVYKRQRGRGAPVSIR